MSDNSKGLAVKGTPSKAPQAKNAQPAAAAPGAPAMPEIQWKNLLWVAVPLVLLWALVIASGSKIAITVMAVLTGVIVGGGIYLYRLFERQKKLASLMQKASASPEGRKEVLAQLSGSDADKDVMNAVVKAQLEAQDDPEKALDTLNAIDMKKVPALMLDDVRGLKAQLLLLLGKTREAGEICDTIEVSRAQQPESRGMLAATVAEAWARSHKEKEAEGLLETFKPDDAAYAKVRVPLLFARIFVNFANKKKELVRKDMLTLVKEDPNYLGRFMHPKFKVHPELQQIATDVLQRDPGVRQMMQKMGGRQQQVRFRR
ncbi:MAG: hypothetical protein JNK72_08510 [Myxococcales bacterium]|nr:hypothetical protein [Myxococcales bacterium]